MAAKRLRDDFEHDPDQPDEKRMRRLPSFSTVIREAMMMKSLQNFLMAFEPILRRVVKEELQAGLVRSPQYIERSPEMPSVEAPSWKLAFLSPPSLPIFTGSKIEDVNGNPLRIILLDTDTRSVSAPPQLLRVELVPLFGDFPPDDREDWIADEFQKGIVKERYGKRPLLTGEVNLTIRDRCVNINDLQFTDNSSWVRCRKFRIGVRVVPGSHDGPRIREAMTESFVVRDHRGELYKKHYPPLLADEVWRLEKIGKTGAFHRKLESHNIKTVQEFLRLLTLNPTELRTMLGDGMTDRMWEVTTNHARTCLPGDKVYVYVKPRCTIYLNSIFQLVKIEFDGMECTLQQLSRVHKDYVQQLMQEAYEQRANLMEAEVVMHDANNNVPLLQIEPAALPAQAEAQFWSPESQEMGFQVDEAQGNFASQWPGHMYN